MKGEGWFRRVVPVTALAVGLVAILALLLPGVRHQLALSATHEPQRYVELAFGRSAAGTVATCSRTAREARVELDITSHLEDSRDVRFVLTVAGQRHPGSVTVAPGETVHVTRVVDRPRRRAYEVHIALPGEDRAVFAHCGGGAR
jgi:hypothetical protein